ncbi:epidermal growth factor-like protein 7 isoform X6 [Brienomyrus brachyistius]|uniref:epidermal growth factor-like protein 7 isoform X6 n=1 Tax=Brienomyrus brachyistius TaxID=42636 RepID=UPI0020B344FD|nr:epidermal growth factor-like protein 7 isoform X6 [Brienomyrus brachyistius]
MIFPCVFGGLPGKISMKLILTHQCAVRTGRQPSSSRTGPTHTSTGGTGRQPSSSRTGPTHTSTGGTGRQPSSSRTGPTHTSTGGTGRRPSSSRTGPTHTSTGGTGRQPSSSRTGPTHTSTGGTGRQPSSSRTGPTHTSTGGTGRRPSSSRTGPTHTHVEQAELHVSPGGGSLTSFSQTISCVNRTLYRVAYRSVSRLAPVAHSYPECCPGWRRFHSHNCNQAVCAEACANGGTCFRPNQCACVSGWMGHSCQTDVDECSSSKPCSQTCLNTAGSYHCGCRAGYTLAEDGHSCQTRPVPSLPHDRQPSSSSNSTGVSTPKGPDADTVNNITEEVQLLKNKVELLEEKLHQALAPFTSLFPLSLEQSVAERTSFLTQSFQQLERIDSLSEQIGFLEERLETCSCQDN